MLQNEKPTKSSSATDKSTPWPIWRLLLEITSTTPGIIYSNPAIENESPKPGIISAARGLGAKNITKKPIGIAMQTRMVLITVLFILLDIIIQEKLSVILKGQTLLYSLLILLLSIPFHPCTKGS